MNSRERAYVESFIDARRRERFLDALEKPQRRRIFTAEVCHPKPTFLLFKFGERVEGAASSVSMIANADAGDGCSRALPCRRGTLDGRGLGLDEALKEVVGWSCGVVPSCIPGKLAHLESEDGRWILHKP